MESVAGVLMVGCGHIIHHNDYWWSSTLLLYRTLVAIVLSEYNVLVYATVDFYLFYDGDVDIQIWSPSDKKAA